MPGSNGWVKAYRKLLKWPWFRYPNVAHLWEYCRLKATHHARRTVHGGQEIDLEPGQFIFGRKVAARETGLSERQVRTALSKLQTSKCLKATRHSTKQFSVITIYNWERYQSREGPSDQGIDQPATKHRPSTDQAPTTDKKVKKGKKEETSAALGNPPTYSGGPAVDQALEWEGLLKLDARPRSDEQDENDFEALLTVANDAAAGKLGTNAAATLTTTAHQIGNRDKVNRPMGVFLDEVGKMRIMGMRGAKQ